MPSDRNAVNDVFHVSRDFFIELFSIVSFLITAWFNPKSRTEARIGIDESTMYVPNTAESRFFSIIGIEKKLAKRRYVYPIKFIDVFFSRSCFVFILGLYYTSGSLWLLKTV